MRDTLDVLIAFFLQELPSQNFTLNAKAQGFSSRFLSSHAHRGRLIRGEDYTLTKHLVSTQS